MGNRRFSRATTCRIGLLFACGLVVSACASGSTGPAPVTTSAITNSGSLGSARLRPEATTQAAAHPKAAANRRQHRTLAAMAAKPKPKPANRVAEKHPPRRDTSRDVIPLD
jgi:hypothetical protein